MFRRPTIAALAAAGAFLLAPAAAYAQKADSSASGAVLALGADQFFGKQASLTVQAPVRGRVVQAYGTVFESDFLGNGTGGNPWVEAGVGVPFTTGAWTVTPRIGAAFGQLLSGAAGTTTGRGLVAEGIVPNVAFARTGHFVADGFAAFYRAVRSQAAATPDFFHARAAAGAGAGFVQAGVMVEQLSETRTRNAGVVYRWVGPWAQLATSGGTAVRLSAGWNTTDARGTFYAVGFGVPLK